MFSYRLDGEKYIICLSPELLPPPVFSPICEKIGGE